MITVIIGKTCSGKTTLAKRLHEESPLASLYFTDDYIPHGFDKALYVLMEDLRKDLNPDKIVEGVQVPRLLRKGFKDSSFHADRIILCEAEDGTRNQRYDARGKEDKDARDQFDAMILGIFEDYWNMETNKPKLEHYKS